MMKEKIQAVKWVERPEQPGSRTIQNSPGSVIATNQTTMTGPNSAATLAVPRDWNANKRTNTTVSGTTNSWNAGVATSIPSIAERTESAGE